MNPRQFPVLCLSSAAEAATARHQVSAEVAENPITSISPRRCCGRLGICGFHDDCDRKVALFVRVFAV